MNESGKKEEFSFSENIKNELSVSENFTKVTEETKWLIWAIMVSTASFVGYTIRISTGHNNFARSLADIIYQVYKTKPKVVIGKKRSTLTVEDKKVYEEINKEMKDVLGFQNIGATISLKEISNSSFRRAFLKGVFLAAGSVSNPGKTYHLEITVRRYSVLEFVRKLLEQENIYPGYIKRGNYNVLYIKEGQQISDFLLVIGAHNSMMTLESLMVDKSVRNMVNRTVNCDNANIDRITDTGLRQQDLFLRLKDHSGLDFLPQDLRTAALARIEHPEMSIRELGELADPPVGKSGMGHRLKKLEAIALETLECQ